MDLRFWADPETGLPHIYNHGVTEEEVQQVLARPGLNLRAGRTHGRSWGKRRQAAISRSCLSPILMGTAVSSSPPMNYGVNACEPIGVQKGEKNDEKTATAKRLDRKTNP